MFTITRVTKTVGSASAWVDVDCSAQAPAGANGLVFEVYTIGSAATIRARVRKNGSSHDPWSGYLNPGERSLWIVECDSNRVVECWQTDATPANTKFDLIAYTTAQTAVFITPIDKTRSTVGAWTEVDCAVQVTADATGAILRVENQDSLAVRTCAIRKRGAATGFGASVVETNWKQPAGMATSQIVGLDMEEFFEHYVETTGCKIFLCGYLRAIHGWDLQALPWDMSPTAGSWQDVDAYRHTQAYWGCKLDSGTGWPAADTQQTGLMTLPTDSPRDQWEFGPNGSGTYWERSTTHKHSGAYSFKTHFPIADGSGPLCHTEWMSNSRLVEGEWGCSFYLGPGATNNYKFGPYLNNPATCNCCVIANTPISGDTEGIGWYMSMNNAWYPEGAPHIIPYQRLFLVNADSKQFRITRGVWHTQRMIYRHDGNRPHGRLGLWIDGQTHYYKYGSAGSDVEDPTKGYMTSSDCQDFVTGFSYTSIANWTLNHASSLDTAFDIWFDDFYVKRLIRGLECGDGRTIIVQAANTSATAYIGAIRQNGSSDDKTTYSKIAPNFTQTLVVSLDTNRVYEGYSGNSALDISYIGHMADMDSATGQQGAFVMSGASSTALERGYVQASSGAVPLTGSKTAHARGLIQKTGSKTAHAKGRVAVSATRDAHAYGVKSTYSGQDAFVWGQPGGTVYYYVDSDYTGGSNDGSAAHPWTSLGSTEWATINVHLKTVNVTIYLSARLAGTDADQTTSQTLWIRRTDVTSHRLTIDGKSKYNTDDVTASWADYTGESRFKVEAATGGGLQTPYGDRHDYLTVRGLRLAPSDGHIAYLFGGDHILVEDIEGWHTQAVTWGQGLVFEAAVDAAGDGNGGCRDVVFQDVYIHDNCGESVLIGGNGNIATSVRHDGITLNNVTCHGAGKWGIGTGDGIAIRDGIINLEVIGCSAHGNPRHGILLYSAASVSRCLIYDNVGVGIYYADDWGQSPLAHSGVRIVNCVLYRNGGNILVEHTPTGIGLWNVLIANNTCWRSTGRGITIAGGQGVNGLSVLNNLSWESGGYEFSCDAEPGGTTSHDYNCYYRPMAVYFWEGDVKYIGNLFEAEPNSKAVDPLVEDAGIGNFRLTTESPCVDAGTAVVSIISDFAGISRPIGGAHDIGAHELGAMNTYTDAHVVSSEIAVAERAAHLHGSSSLANTQEAFLPVQSAIEGAVDVYCVGGGQATLVAMQHAVASCHIALSRSTRVFCGGGVQTSVRAFCEGISQPARHFLLDHRVTFTCADHFEWHNFNCAPYVPGDATGLIFEVYTTRTDQTNFWAALRKEGSTAVPYGSRLLVGQRTIWTCECDTSKTAEGFVTDDQQTSKTRFDLIGFFRSDAITLWVTPPIEIGGGPTQQWVDVDVSSLVSADCVGVLLKFESQDSFVRTAAARKKGSTDDLHAWSRMPPAKSDFCLVGVDAAKKFQLWREQLNVYVYLAGYFENPGGWMFLDNAVDVTPTGTGWRNVDLTAVYPGALAAIVWFYNAGAGTVAGAVRKTLTDDDNTAYQKIAPSYGQCFLVDLDTGDGFQAYRASADVLVKVMGLYTPSSGAWATNAFCGEGIGWITKNMPSSVMCLGDKAASVAATACGFATTSTAGIEAHTHGYHRALARGGEFAGNEGFLRLDGVAGYGQVASPFAGPQDEFTIEAWVRPDIFNQPTGVAQSTPLVSSWTAGIGGGGGYWPDDDWPHSYWPAGFWPLGSATVGEAGLLLRAMHSAANQSRWEFRIVGAATVLTAPTWMSDAAFAAAYSGWTHVAGVFKGGEYAKLLVNGLEVASQATTVSTMIPSENALWMGRTDLDAGLLGGAIDEIRLWSFALAPARIKDDMARWLTGIEEGLLALWRCDSGLTALPDPALSLEGMAGSAMGDYITATAAPAHVVAIHWPVSAASDAFSLAREGMTAAIHGAAPGMRQIGNTAPAWGGGLLATAGSVDGYAFGGSVLGAQCSAATIAGNPQFTLEAWMRTSSIAPLQGLLELRNGADLVRIEAEGLLACARFDTETATEQRAYGPASVRDGEWHHAALVYDGVRRNSASLELDGSSGYATAGAVFTAAMTEMTVEAWVCTTRFNQRVGAAWSTPLVSNWNTPGVNKGYALRALCDGAGKTCWQFVFCDGTTFRYVDFDALDDGEFAAKYSEQWLHTGGSFKSGGQAKFYLNGEAVATVSLGVTQMSPDISGKEWLGRAGIAAGYLPGRLDEVRLWTVQRSDADILADYRHEVTDETLGLAAYWKFNEAAGTVATDAAIGAHNATIEGGFTWSSSVGFTAGLGRGTYTGQAIIYVDGNPGAPVIIQGAVLTSAATFQVLGAMGEGEVDEIRVWNLARTAAEVKSAMTHELAGTEAGLIGYWRFNEGQGMVSVDATGRGHDAVLLGSPQWSTEVPPMLAGSRDREDR